MKRCVTKNNRFNKALIRSFILLFLSIFIIFIYLELVVNPIIIDITYAEIDSKATTAISDAIYEVLEDDNINYNSFFEIKFDDENKITSIVADVKKTNLIAREISTASQNHLDKLRSSGVNVSLGAFSGMPIFNEVGPDVTIQLMPIGSIITSFDSKFEDAGINQTKHSLYIDINATISIIMPTSSKTLSFVTKTLICENIIVGDVPTVYLNA